MNIGELRHCITLQKPVKTQSPTTGAVMDRWETVGQVWASVVPVSVREFVASRAEQNTVTARIKIRRRDDITAKWRILFRGKIYNIEGVLPDPASGLEYITLPCSEGANDG